MYHSRRYLGVEEVDKELNLMGVVFQCMLNSVSLFYIRGNSAKYKENYFCDININYITKHLIRPKKWRSFEYLNVC